MGRRPILWKRLLRRCAAAFLAALAVLALLAGAGGGLGQAFLALGEEPAFVAAALRTELGAAAGRGGVMDELDLWERLVVDQSALLRAGLSGAGEEEPEEGTNLDLLPQGGVASPSPAPEVSQAPAPAGEGVQAVERTLVVSGGEGYEETEGLYLYNRTGLPVDMAAAWSAGVDIALDDAGPQILLVHTHGSEAYAPEGEDVYVPSDGNSRTLDEKYNVVRIGDEMAEVFTEMGLTVLHDRTLYDYPEYNGAYTRSGEAVSAYLAEYPSIRIVLDIHRDALVGSDGTVYKAVTTVDGAKTAQVMLVLGSGSGHPNWQANLSLALRVQKSLDTLYPTLARPITLRGSVYNQDLSPGSLLVEVGTHGNTLQEALRGARCFARAAGQVFLNLK